MFLVLDIFSTSVISVVLNKTVSIMILNHLILIIDLKITQSLLLLNVCEYEPIAKAVLVFSSEEKVTFQVTFPCSVIFNRVETILFNTSVIAM
jgi:hypothetical protein